MSRHLRWPAGTERDRVARRVLAVLGAAPPARTDTAESAPVLGAVPAIGPDRAAADYVAGRADERSPTDRAAPDIVSRFRVDPGRRPAWAVGVVAILTVILTGWWVVRGRPHTDAVVAPAAALSSASPGRPSASGAGSVSSAGGEVAASGSTSTAQVEVDVVGKVARPGVYSLAAGARVHDALRSAGGALAGVDLTSINLARKVADGEQIAVGVAGSASSVAPVGSAGGATGSGAATGSPVDLNTATTAQLDGLPGVGPVLAQHILDWRAAHVRFDSVDQLRDVSGIGPSKYASLRPLVTV